MGTIFWSKFLNWKYQSLIDSLIDSFFLLSFRSLSDRSEKFKISTQRTILYSHRYTRIKCQWMIWFDPFLFIKFPFGLRLNLNLWCVCLLCFARNRSCQQFIWIHSTIQSSVLSQEDFYPSTKSFSSKNFMRFVYIPYPRTLFILGFFFRCLDCIRILS